MMARSAVVFGGCGFIGRHLLRYLKNSDYKRIVSADLQGERKPIDGVEYIICDVRHPLDGFIDGEFDEVYNLAAVHKTPGHADHEYYDTNVSGAINIARFCELHRINTLYFTSSISVYGTSDEPKTEQSPLVPVSAYGKSKLQAEDIHQLWAQSDRRRRLFIARLGVIFGPGENGNFTRLAKALSTGYFFYPGRRNTIKGCAYVEEVLHTFRFVLNLPEPIYTYNIAYPEPYTIEQICQVFHEVGGLPLPKGKIPTTVMMTAVLPFETINYLGLHNPVCRARVQKLVKSTFVVPERLLNDGYIFETDLRGGLKRWREADPKGRFV
jgi:nucleoside-diphosphate-sugar epimerase